MYHKILPETKVGFYGCEINAKRRARGYCLAVASNFIPKSDLLSHAFLYYEV